MLSLPAPSKPPSMFKCKIIISKSLSIWLVVVMAVSLLMAHAQAGVIKKREIPFTTDATTTATAPEEATTTAATTTTTTLVITHHNNDPDIAQSILSVTSSTELTPVVTAPFTVITMTGNNETITVIPLSASNETLSVIPLNENNDTITVIPLQKSNDAGATELKLNPVEKSSDLMTDHLGNSREYALNEIALNETKKVVKVLETTESKPETFKDLSESVAKDAPKKTNEIMGLFKKEEETKQANNILQNSENVTETDTGKINEKLGDFGNELKNSQELNTKEYTESSSRTESVSAAKTTADSTDTLQQQDVENRLGSTQIEQNTEGLQKDIKAASVAEMTTETIGSFEDQAKATTSALKDNSIETNHIMDNTQQTKVTNENITLKPSSMAETEVAKSQTFNLDDTLRFNGTFVDLTTSLPLGIQDGIDRESWKELTNDLPDRTTEGGQITQTQVDANTAERARAMFMSREEGDQMITTIRPASIASTTVGPLGNHLDQFRNSIEDMSPPTPLPGEKKAKFINDNSTNAQKLNLPSNAEVWSLAGMKPLTHEAMTNVTIETAPKHKDQDSLKEREHQQQQHERYVTTTTAENIVNANSEKLLLDWSHITMNKDLATTANYQDNYVADPVVTTTAKSSTEARQPVATLLESEENNLSPTHYSDAITANSTILSEAANIDNGKDDKQQQSRLEMLTSTVTAINSSNGSGIITVQPVMPSSVGGTKTTTNPDLNEINLTLNKTSETDVLVGERFHYGDELDNNAKNNREAEGNVLEHADVTTEATAATTAVMDDMTNSNNKNNGGNNDDNNNNSATTVSTTTTAAMGITAVAAETTTPSSTTTAESTTTAVTLAATSPSEKISSETMTTTLSTLETGKVNASNTTTTTEHFVVADNNNNNNRVFVKSETGDSLREKENIELYAAATTTTTEPITSYTTSSDIPDITTYKPKFLDKNFSINIGDTTTATTTTAANGHQIAKAEVVDQNGNEIVEQKQSINVETTTAAAATTTTTTTSSLNQSSSTAIKTHLNEQVFETATTTTETETAEKTTSSSAKDEIINNNNDDDDNKDFQLEITTPNQTAEATTTTPTTTTPTTTSESSTFNVQVEQTNTTTVNGSTVAQKGQTAEREFEASTTSTDLQKTPVASVDETTTTNASIKEQEKDDTTTKSSVDTYFKYPINSKGQRKQEQKEAEDEDDLNTTEATKDEQYETTTINMSEQTTGHFSTSTTTTPLYTSTNINALNNNTTTKEEETYISLVDETTSSKTTTTTPTTTAVSDIVAQTTSISPTTLAQPSLGSPSETSTPSSTLDEVPITSKIEDVYKVIVSTSSELPETTTSVTNTYAKLPEIEETEEISSYTTISANFPEDFPTPTNMLPFTSTPRSVITADIGSSVNSLPPLMGGGSSGNMFPKNTEASGETDVNVIIAITVSVIGVVALILLVAFLYLMRKRQKQTSYSQRCRPVSLDEYAIDNASVGGSMRKSSVFRSSKRTYGNLAFDDPSLRHNPLGVHELAKFSVEKLRIFEEFRDVPQITAREDEVPQGCEDKNRYANVLPLPETRVVLQRLNDDDKTEYINANYVTGPKDSPNYYIACQAPLESTIEDFWRMIWEQQSRVIIQATDLIENGVEKCAEYLPPSVTLDNHATFGDFQITLQNREVKDKYAISTILLKNNAENVARELTHYWYKWPETGVPAEEAPIIAMLLEARSSLISYAIEQANEDKEKSSNATLKSAEEGTATVVNGGGGGSSSSVSSNAKEVNGNAKGGGSNGEINGNISLVPLKKTARNQGPLTIHCSPGTGRTGTIIGCDIAIRSLETPKRIVDIPHIVYYVRRGRASAVLTKEQYEFIYKVANVYAAKISNPTTYN